MPSSFLRVPLESRVSGWGALELGRWSREIALACANAGTVMQDQPFELSPTGKTPEEAFLRACDPSYWRRNGAKKLRIAQEASELANGLIGKTGEHLYAGPTAAVWSEHAKAATEIFMRTSMVFDHDRRTYTPLLGHVPTEATRWAKHYTMLKGMEALAEEAGLRWAMLTITLPPEWHANPEHRQAGHAWNGRTADEANKVIALGWRRIRSAVAKHGIKLAGLRAEEPMGDATPHWHVCFFYRDDRELHQICRAVLRQFPAGLRICKSRFDKRSKKLRKSAMCYVSLAAFEDGKGIPRKEVPAQCQVDIGTPKAGQGDGIATFASYVLKYTVKGIAPEKAEDGTTAQRVKQHHQTYSIRGIEFFGLPKGAATAWDMLRQVPLLTKKGKATRLPGPVRELAQICQMEKGAGMVEFLKRLGGLSNAPSIPWCKISMVREKVATKYQGEGSRIIGIQIETGGKVTRHILKRGQREIMREEAARALASSSNHGEVREVVSGPAAEGSGLVKIGVVATSSKAQSDAVSADPAMSHTVIAAAGSGKTTVLVNRVAYLLRQGIKPADVAVATFTREAAANISERLEKKGLRGMHVGTMHSLAGRWLARGVRTEELGFDALIETSTLVAKAQPDTVPRLHLLLDEAQDLSAQQWEWARAHAKTIYAVGDFRQAIYGWRNASSGLLLEQAQASSHQKGLQLGFFGEVGQINLPTNFRSQAAIVGLGNAIAGHAYLATSMAPGGSVSAVTSPTLSEEIKQLGAWARRTSGSKAILARTNREVARIKGELTLAGLSVPVMTIHASKGGEWDSVALASGHRKPSEEATDAREVFYVAATRARHSLLLTSVGALPVILADAIGRLARTFA